MKFILMFLSVIFVSCHTVPNYIEKEYILSEKIEEVLTFHSNISYVSRMELIIEGSVSNSILFVYRHQPFDDDSRKSEKKVILNGNIKEIIQSDWYEPECLIQFIPENPNTTGKIILKYRVY
ncbi:MAG: hypothetical protein Ta2B_10040 [Termitinemataceae bacterium]|nr:MAG: hypothetical protein Ta2B_10040 [Termitinemataceae bacterium]